MRAAARSVPELGLLAATPARNKQFQKADLAVDANEFSFHLNTRHDDEKRTSNVMEFPNTLQVMSLRPFASRFEADYRTAKDR